ncbi:Cof subfamily protein (haloacid dehalogenase superfamily) [Thermoanaerobacterium butyriciformans]|uniref:Cof subfamily protein (Haloacid dehalogenase superfamily) n=2 Tax=Thermoanaerobacterium butyriciformans TaxID=1702242 RepID=A0ABS4ND14_9THEO|nr:Cof subfamily protein (haloacid dehalogenase superfamily) [Thermoanaerobacterium butyriciformans]
MKFIISNDIVVLKKYSDEWGTMMAYKLVAIDMDDTLLTHDKQISRENLEALQKAHDSGIYVVISTGRIYASAYAYSEFLGFKPYIIASNGAMIRDDKDIEIYKSVLDLDLISYLIELANKNDIYYHFYSDKIVYSPESSSKYQKYGEWNRLYAETLRVKVEDIPKDIDFTDKLKDNIVKFVMFDEDSEKIKRVRDIIDNNKGDKLETTSSFYNNIEILNKGVNKGHGLKILGEYLGVDRAEMVAIGDSENDIEMVEYAGLGVAMENAIEKLKKTADFITKSNMENGVAYVINKFIL